MQKMDQVITLSAIISRRLGAGEDGPMVSGQDDKIALISRHWQELVTLVNNHVYVEEGWQLEVSFDIKCSPTRKVWGMGYLKFWRQGKLGGCCLEEVFSFKVSPGGFSKDHVLGLAPKLSPNDILVKVLTMAEKSKLGRKKTPEESDIDLTPERRRKTLAEEAICVLE